MEENEVAPLANRDVGSWRSFVARTGHHLIISPIQYHGAAPPFRCVSPPCILICLTGRRQASQGSAFQQIFYFAPQNKSKREE
jgi:hypothetical protein